MIIVIMMIITIIIIKIIIMIIIITSPNGLSLLGWLMGRARDIYKMSHKAHSIYSL